VDSSAQVAQLSNKIGQFQHIIGQQRVRADRAVVMVNQFLMPALNYSIGMVLPTDDQLKRWDNRIAQAISKAAGTGGRCITPAALACITGLELPSVREQVVKLGELHVTLNDPRNVLARLLEEKKGSWCSYSFEPTPQG
jgi:hypothetical protein